MLTKRQIAAQERERATNGRFKIRTAKNEDLQRDYEAGLPLDDIYAKHRTSRRTLMREAKAGGWVRGNVHLYRREVSMPDWFAKAAEMRAAGITREEVARHFNVTPPAVTYAVRRAKREPVQVPAWVPPSLRDPYTQLASVRGEIAAARWARQVKAEMRP